ncbi:LamG-like jellyroll fold domain-containing protein [Actinoplanes sp. DH11]|uniref:LamG-like jellyroll fold domain-containing protein n=1 Tax=Actinoplanes sp. DH11 TaxID=2857011 RepID=UPI001E5E5676|nr:LamG-like jellyroll fold domain-containing protein [Actinoplanes sp. DH11]
MSTAIAALLITSTVGIAHPAHAETPTPAPTVPPEAPPIIGQPPQDLEGEEAPAPRPADPVGKALDEAKKTGAAVSIPSMTDEFSTTVATPDGSFSTTYSVSPERVKKDGNWVDIDTTLVRNATGDYVPKAAAANVTFGAGEDTTLVTLKRGGSALTFTWDSKLPKPSISGDTATYAEVLPDVDLQLTANATGYSSIFVVKTRKAAADPEVQELTLGLSGKKVKIAQSTAGSAEAVDTRTGEKVFQANAALMWDSTPDLDTSAENAAALKPLDSPRDAHEAASSLGRNRAAVKLGFSKGKQSLTLDKTLLNAATTKYPVYVDPDWSAYFGNQSAWARISSNGWNVYNSTATTGSYSARIGLDDWPGGAGERARTYYKINTSGIKGAIVKSAHFNVKHRWSASCAKTAAVVYATGTPAGFTDKTLYWGKEPQRGSLLDTELGQELKCGTSSPAASPASFPFDVTNHIRDAAKNKWNSAHFLVEAKDMSDRNSWKQLGYKGGASLSVQYSYRPTLNADDKKQHVFPSVKDDSGRVITTSRTPTLRWRATNRFPNGTERNLMVDYHIENVATKKLVTWGYGPGENKYNKNGSDWQTPVALPDGNYRWRVTAKNQDGLWAPAWGPYMYFTVDATAPGRPTIRSTQFPSGMVGDAYSDKGKFVFGNDLKNNVIGYLFSLDGNLANVTSATATPWVAGTAIKRGVAYYAKADNSDGTGAVVINGSAAPVFAPGTAGAHALVAKAVDQAGTTSLQTTYEFIAGTSTPVYVYGEKLVSGWTATNTDGTTTVVPPSTTTSTTGELVVQSGGATWPFVTRQVKFANKSTTSTVRANDTATFYFNLPHIGLWQLGANLTTAADYGTYSLTLDKGKATETELITFDAYSSRVSTTYRNLGIPKDADETPLVLDQGLHTLTLKVTGKNPSAVGYQAGIDVLRLAPTLTCAINDTRGCLNNKAISKFTAGTTPTVTTADADGYGHSLEVTDLRNAGWAPNATVTAHGAAIKLPGAGGDGKDDNMLSSGQVITVPKTGVVNKGNAVVFLGFAVNGAVKNATGRVTYAKDSGCNVSSQAYTIDWVPDWAYPPTDSAVLPINRRNRNTAVQYTNLTMGIGAFSIPLVCPDAAVTSVSLPLVSGTVVDHPNALHVLGIGIRPVSKTGSGNSATRWVGTWSSAQDTAAIPGLTLNGQTIRIPVRLSIGTGTDPGKVRIRLDNSRGKTPVTFSRASVALQDPASGGAATTGEPLPLTFGGSNTLTLPVGSERLSDPVDLAVPDLTTALISLQVAGSRNPVPGHLNSPTPFYVSATGGANHTADIDGAAFTESTATGLPYLAGIDVSTASDAPAGALVLYGDQTINSDSATRDGRSQLSDHIATALSTDEFGNPYPLRTGVLSQGSSAGITRSLLPTVGNDELPPNAYGLTDRQILSQTNARTVLVSAGAADLLACTGTADACAGTVQAKLHALANQLQQYKADDALDYRVPLPTASRGAKVYVATIPPFIGTYTAVQENARKLVNAHVLSGGVMAMDGYADGFIDFAAAVSADGTTVKAELLSSGRPNDDYYRTLAQQFVIDVHDADAVYGDGEAPVDPNSGPVGEWAFKEGKGTGAGDSGSGYPSGTFHDAPLSNVGWGLGRGADRKAGVFNGSTSFADTQLPFNTARSFTVSAWVKLSDKATDRTFFAKQGAENANDSFTLQYDKARDGWRARMPSAASGDTVKWSEAVSNDETPVRVGVWTHLAAVYDASTNALTLFVNGEDQSTADEVLSFNNPDTTAWIGRSEKTYFAGDISDVSLWLRPLAIGDVQIIAAPKAPTVNWQFEDQSADIATDSSYSDPAATGTFAGGTSWNVEGHPLPADATDGVDVDRGSVNLNGTDAAVTTRARLRTDQSYTVAAWARLTSGSTYVNVVGQAGAHSSAFQLNYGSNCRCWRFVLTNTDTDANPASVIVQDPTATALNTWTHLAAVYDATAGTARLYVNGVEVAQNLAVPPRTWNATGDFIVGRAMWNSALRDYFPGGVDDVSAYQEALTGAEITNLMRSESVKG